MLKPLYLDTARLGQMSPRACRASVDFSRFAAEFGGDLYLSKLLSSGFDSWPQWMQEQFEGLSEWQGIAGLKANLRSLSQANEQVEVALASRSSSLMQFGAKLLSGPCRNVLVTDLSWPGYQAILQQQSHTAACRVSLIPLREKIMRDGVSSSEVVQLITAAFHTFRCDGLFLPLIDNFGVKLPVRRIVRAIESSADLRFVLVDGAQALGQIPLELSECYCDLLIASTQKWLRAYSPMGVGFYCMRQNGSYVHSTLERWTRMGYLEDPLLRFTMELETGRFNRFGETVSIAPLFNVNAACIDALARIDIPNTDARTTIDSYESLHGWTRLATASDMESKASVFKAGTASVRKLPAEVIRSRFFRSGLVVSAYDKGLVRVSEPTSALIGDELDQLVLGFNGVPHHLHYSCR
ncbi:Aminotransferase class-V [Pirellula sp. SH-Sr6A]|nr:Aminotransferase class-V [Pirellula sp. SH-Sr6A]